MNEQEMRDSKAPWPETTQELSSYIESLTGMEHDYGTCVYAMSLAATAAFQHVAKKLGVTGFQASCADMDILRRTRMMDGPFIILKAEDACYPQYNLHGRLSEFMESVRPWIAEQCAKKLAADGETAHPNVVAHWKQCAAYEAKPK